MPSALHPVSSAMRGMGGEDGTGGKERGRAGASSPLFLSSEVPQVTAREGDLCHHTLTVFTFSVSSPCPLSPRGIATPSVGGYRTGPMGALHPALAFGLNSIHISHCELPCFPPEPCLMQTPVEGSRGLPHKRIWYLSAQ